MKYRIVKKAGLTSPGPFFYVEKKDWLLGWMHVKVCSSLEEAKTYIPKVYTVE